MYPITARALVSVGFDSTRRFEIALYDETIHLSLYTLALPPRVFRPLSELFLERFAAQAFSHAEKLGRRTIKYQDVSDVRVEDPNLLFLEAVVPP